MRKKILRLAVVHVVLAAAFTAFLVGPDVLAPTEEGKRWIGLAAGLVGLSLVCWLPFVYSLSGTISRLGQVTNQIATGRLRLKAPGAGSDELGVLGQSINNMAHRFEQMLKGQKRFLGDVAHELSAPIARIQFALGVLETTVDEAGQADLKALHDEIQEMSALVSELLAFSRASLDAGSATLSRVNLLQAVQRASDRENIPVEMFVSPSAVAMAHEVYLTRAVGNLLRNAHRYAGAGRPIEVYAHSEGALMELIVADHGPGLPESELEQIFEPFYRMDASRTRSTGGKGLGLAIVKSCVEVCHGEVFCRNRKPNGLEVVIRLTPGAAA